MYWCTIEVGNVRFEFGMSILFGNSRTKLRLGSTYKILQITWISIGWDFGSPELALRSSGVVRYSECMHMRRTAWLLFDLNYNRGCANRINYLCILPPLYLHPKVFVLLKYTS